MAFSIKKWFAVAVSDKPQTVDFILPRMALTVVDPTHEDRLRNSCHSLAAHEIARLSQTGELSPSHNIVMLGLGPSVYHTILVKDGDVVFDSDNQGGETRFDAESGKYVYPQRNSEIKVLAQLGCQDFLARYASKVKPGPALSEPALQSI